MASRLTSALLVALLTVGSAAGSLACELNCTSVSLQRHTTSAPKTMAPDAAALPSTHHLHHSFAKMTSEVTPVITSTLKCHFPGIAHRVPATCALQPLLKNSQLDTALRTTTAANAMPMSYSDSDSYVDSPARFSNRVAEHWRAGHADLRSTLPSSPASTILRI